MAVCLALVGCDGGAVRFAPDGLLRATAGLTAGQSASVDAALDDWFGEPDQPRLPDGVEGAALLLDPVALALAAGPVESHTVGVTHGLFRRHCARCHGVTGDGRGPTALYQDPQPRDFRRGVFKWKSTWRDAPPTDADLQAVFEHGVPGTAMPSFALLTIDERDALRQYVQYLALRGAAERELVRFLADEAPPGEPLDWADPALREELTSRLAPHVAAWVASAERFVPPPEPAGYADDPTGRLAAGRALYHGEAAGCHKCHGPAGQGGATPGVDYPIDYGLWSRDRVEAQKSDAPAVLAALRDQLPPVADRPRRLVGEAMRGGAAPDELYRRLHQGIAGTTMPALGPRRPGGEAPLTDEQITLLAEYVGSLLAPEAAGARSTLTRRGTR